MFSLCKGLPIVDPVLVFPPLLSHYRFLTHQIVNEDFVDLASFSVGEADNRRTVVCSGYLRIKSATDIAASRFNKMSSNSGTSDRYSKPSRGRGRGRGRGKKEISNEVGEKSNTVDQQQVIEKECKASSSQKPANEMQKKKPTDKTRKSRKPDQALYVPKSRKPDQALYVPRSRRVQENQTSATSKTKDTPMKKTEISQGQVKRTQNDKAEPPPKKKPIVVNESETISRVHVEKETVQEDKDQRNMEVAMNNKEAENYHTDVNESKELKHQNVSNSVAKPELSDENQVCNPIAMDVESQTQGSKDLLAQEKSLEVCSENLISSNNLSSRNVGKVQDTPSQEIASHDCMTSQETPLPSNTDTAMAGLPTSNQQHSTESSVESELLCVEKQNENPTDFEITQDKVNDFNMTESSSENVSNGNKCTVDVSNLGDVSNIVDKNIESLKETELNEEQNVIKTSQGEQSRANKNSISEEDKLSKPTMEEFVKENRLKELEETIEDPETLMDSCAGDANSDTAGASDVAADDANAETITSNMTADGGYLMGSCAGNANVDMAATSDLAGDGANAETAVTSDVAADDGELMDSCAGDANSDTTATSHVADHDASADTAVTSDVAHDDGNSMDICAGDANADTAATSDLEDDGTNANTTVISDVADDDGDDWEALFDESGDALASDALDEISEGIGNVKVSVKKTKQDYYNYHAKDNFDYGRFSHVIEIFDFPSEFKTMDLIQSFSGYRIKGFDIKWVDDTHALGIFSSTSIAQDALSLQNPMLRTRSLDQATRESKLKARNCVDFLQPAKPRPETSASAARRLVSGALGIKSKETKEQRATELKKLKDAKEKKKIDKWLTEDIWEGNTWRL